MLHFISDKCDLNKKTSFLVNKKTLFLAHVSLQPAAQSKLDPAVLASLPPSMQLDLLVQVSWASNRHMFLTSRNCQPELG